MRRQRLWWFVVAASAGVAATQQPLREPAIGEVRDRDGKPWPGATVHFLHRAHPGIVEPTLTDAFDIVADARGRFRADVLAGRPYVIWATAPGEGGAFRCTEVAHPVVAGAPTILTEGEPRRVRTLQVSVDASWTTPLTIFARATLGQFALVQRLGTMNEPLVTPPWPLDAVTIEAHEGERMVARVSVPLTMSGARADDRVAADADLADRLAAPAEVHLGVRTIRFIPLQDAAAAPIADAIVQADDQPFARLLGTTDAAGKLELVTAGETNVPRMTVLSASHAEFPFDSDNVTADGKPAEALDLTPGSAMRGRLLIGEDKPLGGVPLILDGSIRNSDNGWWWGVNPRLLASAADGTFAVRGRLERFPLRLTAVLPTDVLAQLRGDHRTPLWPQAIVVPETADPTKDVGDIRLDRLAAVEVQLTAADGSPPGSLHVAVFPLYDAGEKRWPVRALLARTDRHGRLRVLAPRGLEVVVFAAAPSGSAFGFAVAGGTALSRALDPAHVVRLQVFVDDKPLVGARLSGSNPRVEDGTGDLARIKHLLEEPMVHSWFPLISGTTDAEGRLTLVAPAPGLQLGGWLASDGKTMHIAIDLRQPQDDPIRIEFVPRDR